MRKLILLILLWSPSTFSQLVLDTQSQFIMQNQDSLTAIKWFETQDFLKKTPLVFTPVTVAVIDSGVSQLHPFLAPQLLINHDGEPLSYDFVNQRSFMIDDHGHGSHVAGIIIGVNPRVKILPLKVLAASGNGSVENVTEAIRYAVNKGVRVINLSLGAIDILSQNKVAYEAAIAWARLFNVLIIASAGNDSSNNDIYSFYPSGIWQDNVLSICATDPLNRLADFSNYGHWKVHLCAPGVNIVSANNNFADQPWVAHSGTSQAAPIVSAAASLLLSINPNLKAFEVRNKLMESTTVSSDLNGLSQTGGVLNLYQAVLKSF